MTGRALFDSSILVSTFDAASPDKQRRSARLLDGIAPTGRGVLSTQVLGEFFRVVTQKLAVPLTPAEAYVEIERLVAAWLVPPITPVVVLDAARGGRDHGLSYRDGQLWATARLNQVETVVSEDFQDGRGVEGVRFVNPFGPSFDLAALLA
jgi:predicted nucleic acid-binding protein